METKKIKVDKVPPKSKEANNKRKKESAEASDQEAKQPATKRKRTAAASKPSPKKDLNDNKELIESEGKTDLF